MSNTIDQNLVRHVAKLSRIAVTDEQVVALAPQLAGILSYFDKLQQLDTDGVEPMAHALEIHNVLAEDVLGQSLTPDEALANAPDREGNLFRVPKVIRDSQ